MLLYFVELPFKSVLRKKIYIVNIDGTIGTMGPLPSFYLKLGNANFQIFVLSLTT